MQTASPERIELFRRLGWWDDTTTWHLLEAAVAAHPDDRALVDPPNRAAVAGGEPLSFSWLELRSRALALAAWLREEGIGREDIVVMQLPNTAEAVLAYLALAALGAIASPVPMQYGMHELKGIAAALRPRAFLAAAAFRGEDFSRRHAGAFDASVRCLALGADRLQALSRAGQDVAPADVSADDVFTVCWTSGTTGTPKGVPRSHNQWRAQTVAVMGLGIEPRSTMLCPFPLVNMASIAGFFYPWLLCRGTLVLHHPLELPVFLAQLETERVHYTVAPPALLNMLLKQRELLAGRDLSRLRLVASGSAPLAPWMVRGFQQEYGIEVVNIFGSNEGMALNTSARDVPDPEQRATLFPRFGVAGLHWSNPIAERIRTRLVDPLDGNEVLEPGVAGEMQIWGPNVFDGYFEAPDANREAFSADGWFRSGDLFEIAAEDPRFYRFVGRCKDLIIRGGMKISPEELDTLLAGHPLLAEAAVVGYPDELLGERICAVVVPRAGAAPVLADIVAFLETQGVARIKLPERLLVLEALPRNPLGKLLRGELAARMRA